MATARQRKLKQKPFTKCLPNPGKLTSSTEQERFVLLRRASYSLSLARERVTRERGTLLGACRAPPDKSVSRGRAFRQDSCPGEKAPASMPTPLRACRPRLTASQGGEDQGQVQRRQPS